MSANIQLLSFLAIPAHVPIENINEFYAGILHPLMVPAHIMTIILVGLTASRIPGEALGLSRLFMTGLTVGLVASGFGVTTAFPLWLLYVMLCLLGVYVASNFQYRQPLFSRILLVTAGLLMGLDTTCEELRGGALWLCLVGSLIGAGFVAFYVALIAKKAKKKWQHIAIRVVASWIGAIGLLMLALELAHK